MMEMIKKKNIALMARSILIALKMNKNTMRCLLTLKFYFDELYSEIICNILNP